MVQENLLLELGTEELPPKALRKLAQALHDSFVSFLQKDNIHFEKSEWYATPRRLALFITNLDDKQADREIELKGPSIKVAYDENHNPTKAALGWCKANNVDIKDVQTLKQGNNEWLYFKTVKPGQKTVELIPELFKNALAQLPIPKLMHWGDKHDEFVRPVHTLTMLYGDQLIEGNILGIQSSNKILGHRFMGEQSFEIKNANDYVNTLKTKGLVIPSFEERKESIKKQVQNLATSINGVADLDDSLLEEVASLVENPNVFLASFEERFLSVPAEALVYTMKGDQKYFPIYDKNGKLLPKFAFVSNINPSDTSSLISGNERVVRPRLSDAEFFFKTDRKHNLEYFYQKLENIVYQKDIGTIAFRSEVVGNLAAFIGNKINADTKLCQRAAHLAKCDLATTLVNEFTDTQGIMGMHYAELDGEDQNVAEAIFEQYLPRFAGDKIPTKPVQVSVSLAEKLATLVGIFGVNLLPKGDKDPYGLRRAAIGLIRIIIENKINIDLKEAIDFSAKQFGKKIKDANDTTNLVLDYVLNRLKAYYQDQGIGAEIFLSVYKNKPTNILDFDNRVKAVVTFKSLEVSNDLAQAYKRVSNILSKNTEISNSTIDTNLFENDFEKALFEGISSLQPKVNALYAEGNYTEAMKLLSGLNSVINNFFEKVMVNAEDPKIKQNRLALLKVIEDIFGKTADISVLY